LSLIEQIELDFRMTLLKVNRS